MQDDLALIETGLFSYFLATRQEVVVSNIPPIVNLTDVEQEAYAQGDDFAAILARVGQHLGSKKIGITLVELDSGKKAWPYHLHFGQEEIFVVLEGHGTLRYDDKRYELSTGDVALTPAGPNTAHQIINTSEQKLRYLALSSKDDPEVCYYPDSDKIGAYAGERPGRELTFLARKENATDYWDRE